MRVATIFEYLMGRSRAIVAIASDRRWLGVGAILVLSAGLARSYDQTSLLHEPWRLLGPFAASLAISGVLFLGIYGFVSCKSMEGPGIGAAYVSFLSLYWMTAPLAWLYGIPYERFLPLAAATEANLWTLALVSFWRVALMTRAVSVIFNLRIRAALALVMLIADGVALAALHLLPLPVIPIMGGVSPEQTVIAVTTLLVKFLGWLTLPVWIALTAIAVWSRRSQPQWCVPVASQDPAQGRGALAFAGLAVAGWAVLLPLAQPEQIRASRVDRVYRDAGPPAAVALMSTYKRVDFPAGWQPPPRRFPGEPPTSEVLDVLDVLTRQPHGEWVCTLYRQRFRDRLRYDSYRWPDELLGQHAPRLAQILTRLHHGAELARALQYPERFIEKWLDPDRDQGEVQRGALKTLLELAEQDASGPPRDRRSCRLISKEQRSADRAASYKEQSSPPVGAGSLGRRARDERRFLAGDRCAPLSFVATHKSQLTNRIAYTGGR